MISALIVTIPSPTCDSKRSYASFPVLTECCVRGANFAPSPDHLGCSDCGTFPTRNRRAPILLRQSRKFLLSRIVNRSCFFRCATSLLPLQQTHADRRRKAAVSLQRHEAM